VTPIIQAVRQQALHVAKASLRRTIGPQAYERARPQLRWLRTRVETLGSFGPIYHGHQIVWDRPMEAVCDPFLIGGLSEREVLIRTIVSAISPGTEAAFFSQRPNAETEFPHSPGYSIAGEVIALGRRAERFTVGQLVAAPAQHASLAKLQEEAVLVVPAGVTPEEAAFVQLGTIVHHALWRSKLARGDRVAIFGRGIIGQLSAQIARAVGAGELVSVAPSNAHVLQTLGRYADRVIATDETGRETLHELGVDVAFEASGDPQALHDAVAATRNGGRVVLLGSPRGTTRDFDFGVLADRKIRLIGAHISTLSRHATQGCRDAREGSDAFLRLVADRRLHIKGLINFEVNPWEAGWFYRHLAEKRLHCVGAVFRWDKLDAFDRLQASRYWFPVRLPTIRRWSMLPSGGYGRSARSELSSSNRLSGADVRRLSKDSTAKEARRLRVAIVGCGGRGAENGVAAQRANQTSLAVVMDVSDGPARRLGERLGVPWTTDYASVLADERIDAVFLSTPHYLHAKQAVLAARAGKHVIVEKPLATTLYDATQMVRAARESGVHLSPWLGKRYLPHVDKAKQLVDAGLLGRLLGAHLTFHTYRPSSYWQVGSEDGLNWRGCWETSGGGALMTQGIHQLDWLLYLSRSKVVAVSAQYATLDSPTEVEDAIVMWLRFENGALATADVACRVQGATNCPISELRLWGTEGHLSLTPPQQFYASRLIDGGRPKNWNALDPRPGNDFTSADVEYLDRFARSVLRERPLEIDAEDGIRLQAVIEAAYRSSREQEPTAVEYPEL
jgi:predicted dehydrogenase/threonine dehydrogenase-like Zn-dependent dehydrogenase